MSNKGRAWTVLSMLEWATDYFEKKNVPSPRMSIEWILADVLQIKRLDIYLQYDRPLSDTELDKIRPMVKRRAAHEPLQYITGYTDFINGTFRVTPDVLIPREETEQLVEILIRHYREKSEDSLNLLDIGTGSGCIPVSLKNQYPAWKCAGIDISAEALRIAKENADTNEAEVTFYEADLLKLDHYPAVFNREWDVIISNPPYITEKEKKEIEPQVIKFEPSLALFHDSPVVLYEKIIRFAALKKASLYLEINPIFASEIYNKATRLFKEVSIEKDLDEKDRFIICHNASN